LPAESRRLLELSYWGGLGRREVAIAVGLPEGTVASRIRKARITLRELMDEDARSADPETMAAIGKNCRDCVPSGRSAKSVVLDEK
jgi:predicted RNA polymerase sigma factor